VAFCGGNTRDIRENIDFRVYQQLMTPNGQKIELYDEPGVMLEAKQNGGPIFTGQPLNDADY
jgi:hypothetical protein